MVSTKVSKRAVVRNKVKRRLREISRELLPNISSGWDVVVMTKPQVVELETEQLRKGLTELLEKARLLKV